MKPRTGAARMRADLSLVLVALIWGSTFVLVKLALDDVSTMLFLALRFGAAAVALWFVFRGRGAHFPRNRKAELKGGFLVGLCLFAGYFLQTEGLRFTTPAKAGFITGFYIPLVPMLGAIIYRRMPQLSEFIGVLMATAGMGLMTLRSARFDIATGDLLVVGCAFSFALHILVLGHYSPKMSYEALTLYQVATCAICAAASFWWVETPKLVWTGTVIIALIVTSLLATALSFAVQSWAQQFTTPTRVALIFSAEPVFAWVTSWAAEGEVLSVRAAAGAILILAGILLVELKPFRLASNPLS